MKTTAYLVAALVPLAYAADCTDSDFLPLATSVLACSAASGVSFTTSTFNLTTAATLCKYTDCKTFLTGLGALKCTESGESLAPAATLCSAVASANSTTGSTSGSSSGSTPTTTASSSASSSGSTTTTAAPSTTATSGVVATVLSSAVVMTAAAAFL
ncbi:unnamed protein product [Aphanomyces euteiches]|uniref:Elicitin-like protein n=1 Tax=Aphanomyces euteiches TaxID=100861 RepID=A0A6G0WLV4_9STRA|nr:hypothetical protein Ae201684_013856 [Aphanomyces euteiches]KAH9080830.1 hypothetical protein Ae201684P_007916 [Aphanomyces euteiches]